MNAILNKLKNITSDCCVTIILQTHRTAPDNGKDSLELKNLIKDVETRLSADYNKSIVTNIMNRINNLAESVDHRYNKECLILFVNETVAEYTRLPLIIENRIVIDKTFATRDLVRALNRETSYYILVLGQDKARLIEAFNDKVVDEVEDGFPIDNTTLIPVQRPEAAIANRQTNLMREFFNRVDKQLNEVHKENPLPVMICADEFSFDEYEKVADRKEIIIGKLYGNRLHEKPHQLVDAVWPVLKKLNLDKNNQRIAELKEAVSSQKFVTDFNEIWKSINEGRGKTLFVKQGYFQPAIFENNHIELVSQENSERANVDDIIDEMIEKNLQFNGDVVFINGEELEKFNGLALVTRY